MWETLQNLDFAPFLLSFKLASIVTLILFFLSIPLAWYLSQSRAKSKPYIEALTALPIVLPPSVLGFYILFMLSQNSPIGGFFEEYFGVKLIFNFTGLVVASCFYSFPFMLQPLQSGFESIDRAIIEASYISGKSQLETLLRVAIPNIKPSILTAIVVSFAHTVGEFGVVLMVGGSIPDETKVASIAIYEMVEILDYESAHIYSAIMVIISFLVLLVVYVFNDRSRRRLGVD
jgi:molybdate transport system permease protein